MGVWFARIRSGSGFFFGDRFGLLGEGIVEIIVDALTTLVDSIGKEMIGAAYDLVVHSNVFLRL